MLLNGQYLQSSVDFLAGAHPYHSDICGLGDILIKGGLIQIIR